VKFIRVIVVAAAWSLIAFGPLLLALWLNPRELLYLVPAGLWTVIALIGSLRGLAQAWRRFAAKRRAEIRPQAAPGHGQLPAEALPFVSAAAPVRQQETDGRTAALAGCLWIFVLTVIAFAVSYFSSL